MPLSANPAACAQAAMLRTELLMARCRSGNLQLIDMPDDTQAHWHAVHQAAFLAWLDAGGFAQSDDPIENSGVAPLFSAPVRDSNEESKFSLLRINDAVE